MTTPSTTSCQRWRERRATFREAPELFDPRAHAVDLIDERPAKAFVEFHHYSRSYPAARLRVGLFHGAQLVGVAVFAEPAQRATLPKYAPGARSGVVLARLVLLDEVAANAETWFLARAFGALRREKPDVEAVVSYADPFVRAALDGRTVMPGHTGIIYQALNGRYLGRSAKETIVLDPAGRVISRRALSKLRNGEQGAEYAERQLVEAGAPRRNHGEQPADYVRRAISEGPFRVARHPGNHVYAWPLRRGVGLAPEGGAYPKKGAP